MCCLKLILFNKPKLILSKQVRFEKNRILGGDDKLGTMLIQHWVIKQRK